LHTYSYHHKHCTPIHITTNTAHLFITAVQQAISCSQALRELLKVLYVTPDLVFLALNNDLRDKINGNDQ
jgi:hypothetical protein